MASMIMQTLIFLKSKFTKEQAISWAKSHGKKHNSVRETSDSFRLRQRPPSDFDNSTYRTVKLTDGVSAVLGKLKSSKAIIEQYLGEEDIYEFIIDEKGIEWTTGFIRKRGNKWCIFSHKGKNLGCYSNRDSAVKRLRQIEFFKRQ